jgi:RNA polymerase-binding protein DksA
MKTEHADVANALEVRLGELTAHIAKIDFELHKALPPDSEEQASVLENQHSLEAIEKAECLEIKKIQGALKRISNGSYGICAGCGADIDTRRLEAMPTATQCIDCAEAKIRTST